MIIWITGLSGAGKTTIGTKVYEQWKRRTSSAVLLDGDTMRRIFDAEAVSDEEAYSFAGRRVRTKRITGLCSWLDAHAVNVVCCTIGNNEDIRSWNRSHYSKYFEVYVRVPIEILVARDQKNLYGPAMCGKRKHVVGIDIPFMEPEHPDFIIDNSSPRMNHDEVAWEILCRSGAVRDGTPTHDNYLDPRTAVASSSPADVVR